jgi:hypothetical protein
VLRRPSSGTVSVVVHGHFPFGRPNTERPARVSSTGSAAALVVGVYPSAWHVSWQAPAYLASPIRRGAVAALAVDVEPTVFWAGDPASFQEMLASWKTATGFIDGDDPGAHGWVSSTSPAANGSSGAKVENRYLAPLGIGAASAAFTDVYPVFVTKSAGRGAHGRREQGDAIRDEYDSVAEDLGVPASSLPGRPTAKQLVTESLERFQGHIVRAVEEADAPLVITLGDETLQVLRRIPALTPEPPTETITDLYGARYGARGHLTVNGRRVEWLPLVHPGLLKGTARQLALDPVKRTGPGWNWLHSKWAQTMASGQSCRP